METKNKQTNKQARKVKIEKGSMADRRRKWNAKSLK